jgi:hypothetical protein
MQFLKRHPYAAILMGLLLLCSSIDLTSWKMEGSPPTERYYGLSQGHFIGGSVTHEDPKERYPFFSDPKGQLRFRSPSLGREWKWRQFELPTRGKFSEAAIPIYAPLLVLGAWVIFREFWKRRTT